MSEQFGLVYKTGSDFESIETFTGRLEVPKEALHTAEQLNKRFKFMCQIFAQHRNERF
jgi:hypothetical protein